MRVQGGYRVGGGRGKNSADLQARSHVEEQGRRKTLHSEFVAVRKCSEVGKTFHFLLCMHVDLLFAEGSDTVGVSL